MERGAKGTQRDPRGPKGTQGDARGSKGTQGRLRRPWGDGPMGPFGVVPKPFRMESNFEWKVITKGSPLRNESHGSRKPSESKLFEMTDKHNLEHLGGL